MCLRHPPDLTARRVGALPEGPARQGHEAARPAERAQPAAFRDRPVRSEGRRCLLCWAQARPAHPCSGHASDAVR